MSRDFSHFILSLLCVRFMQAFLWVWNLPEYTRRHQSGWVTCLLTTFSRVVSTCWSADQHHYLFLDNCCAYQCFLLNSSGLRFAWIVLQTKELFTQAMCCSLWTLAMTRSCQWRQTCLPHHSTSTIRRARCRFARPSTLNTATRPSKSALSASYRACQTQHLWVTCTEHSYTQSSFSLLLLK